MEQYATWWSDNKEWWITHFKFHLAHTDPHSNTKKCLRVPQALGSNI